jgi:hypothetical protein
MLLDNTAIHLMLRVGGLYVEDRMGGIFRKGSCGGFGHGGRMDQPFGKQRIQKRLKQRSVLDQEVIGIGIEEIKADAGGVAPEHSGAVFGGFSLGSVIIGLSAIPNEIEYIINKNPTKKLAKIYKTFFNIIKLLFLYRLIL